MIAAGALAFLAGGVWQLRLWKRLLAPIWLRKHNAISAGELEDAITHAHAHTQSSLNRKDEERDLDRGEIGKETVVFLFPHT